MPVIIALVPPFVIIVILWLIVAITKQPSASSANDIAAQFQSVLA
jgi:hypothetical protein